MNAKKTVALKALEQMGVQVPWQVKSSPSFKFQPVDFTAGNDYLKPKLISEDVQNASYEAFASNPAAPCLYGVGSEPDDAHAKVFAYHLLSLYVQSNPSGMPGVLHLHDRDDPLRDPFGYSFLLITSITPNSTPYRLERLRDLLEHYHSIPRVFVVGGMDPVTYAAEYLRLRLSHVYFRPSQSVNHKHEIV